MYGKAQKDLDTTMEVWPWGLSLVVVGQQMLFDHGKSVRPAGLDGASQSRSLGHSPLFHQRVPSHGKALPCSPGWHARLLGRLPSETSRLLVPRVPQHWAAVEGKIDRGSLARVWQEVEGLMAGLLAAKPCVKKKSRLAREACPRSRGRN